MPLFAFRQDRQGFEGPSGAVKATLSLSSSVSQLREENTEQVARLLQGAAYELSGRLDAVIGTGVDGLVVETGRMMPPHVEILKDALARGITVVVANPYSTGRLHRDTYRHEGAEAHLLSLGMIFAGTSGLKTRVKLTVLLSAGLSRERVRDLFHEEWQ